MKPGAGKSNKDLKSKVNLGLMLIYEIKNKISLAGISRKYSSNDILILNKLYLEWDSNN